MHLLADRGPGQHLQTCVLYPPPHQAFAVMVLPLAILPSPDAEVLGNEFTVSSLGSLEMVPLRAS